MPILRIILFGIFSLLSLQASAQFFDSLSRPALWLRPDNGMITSTQWKDASSGNHAQFKSPLAAVETSTLNFHKVLNIKNADQSLSAPINLESLSELAILAVFQTSDTVERMIWRTVNAENRKIELSTRRATGPDLIIDFYGKHEQSAYLNTIAQSWDKTAPSAAQASFEIGSADLTTGKKFFQGSLAELLVFKRALSFMERAQIETYLAIKYGVGTQGHNYVSAAQKVLWHSEKNAAFKRIAGIGREDAFSLYQKQSGSAYDSGMVVMHVGSLATTNAQNTGVMENGNFVLWGDNGKPLRLTPGTGVDSVLTMTDRIWRVTTTGTEIKQQQISVQIDISRLPYREEGYWLVIDRSGKANFNVDNMEYVMASSVLAGKATFKVLWDKDGSGTDDFALAGAKEFFAIARTIQDPLCTNETAGEISIEVIVGKGPFQYKLSSQQHKLERSGRIPVKTETEEELKAGDYVLTVRDVNGSEVIRNFTLRMPDALYPNAGEDRKLSDSDEIVLDASASIPDSIAVRYLWQNNFGFSAEQKSIQVTESGIYRVTVTKDIDGCSFSDEVVISGAEEQRLAVYPTVVRSQTTFTISASLPEPGNVEVSINNIQGVPVLTFSGKDQVEYQFNASLSTAGTYVVVIQTPLGIESRKVIVN